MTNFEKLKSMSISEFAEWLDKYGPFEDSLWMDWFDEKYCSKCEPIKCEVDKKDAFWFGTTINCAYCELEKKCKFFPALKDVPDNKMIIEMWLEEEAE